MPSRGTLARFRRPRCPFCFFLLVMFSLVARHGARSQVTTGGEIKGEQSGEFVSVLALDCRCRKIFFFFFVCFCVSAVRVLVCLVCTCMLVFMCVYVCLCFVFVCACSVRVFCVFVLVFMCVSVCACVYACTCICRCVYVHVRFVGVCLRGCVGVFGGVDGSVSGWEWLAGR